MMNLAFQKYDTTGVGETEGKGTGQKMGQNKIEHMDEKSV